jgi:hypothetical protein
VLDGEHLPTRILSVRNIFEGLAKTAFEAMVEDGFDLIVLPRSDESFGLLKQC